MPTVSDRLRAQLGLSPLDPVHTEFDTELLTGLVVGNQLQPGEVLFPSLEA